MTHLRSFLSFYLSWGTLGSLLKCHKLVQGPGNWQTSPKIQKNEHKWVKFLLFLRNNRLSFKVSQSVSEINRPDRAKSNREFSYPGPFLLKPRPSQFSLVSWQLANVAKDPGKRARVGQVPTYLKPPWAPLLKCHSQ